MRRISIPGPFSRRKADRKQAIGFNLSSDFTGSMPV
jgi:hypothetical protein